MNFSRKSCGECTFFQVCIGTNITQKSRKLCISPHYDYIRERRIEQKTDSFKEEMRVRSQIEGTINEATRFLGLRYAKYKGEAGHRLQFYLTGACNFG